MKKVELENSIQPGPFKYFRTRLEQFTTLQRTICHFDQTCDVEPGLACEISDLFKNLDESGDVHNYDYSGDTPIRLHGGDFAENPTTYQGAYEHFEYGEPPQGENLASDASEAKQASAVEPQQGETEKGS